VKRAASSGLRSRPTADGDGGTEAATNRRVCKVGPRRLLSSFGSAARIQQKEKELQIVFCNSLISLVSRAGIEPPTY